MKRRIAEITTFTIIGAYTLVIGLLGLAVEAIR